MPLELYFIFILDPYIGRDFNAFDLRMRLPDVVGQLYEAIIRNGGVTYIHCTAGLGRAPAVVVGKLNSIYFFHILFDQNFYFVLPYFYFFFNSN